MKLKKVSREAGKARKDFSFGRAEGAWIKMKIKKILGLGTEDWGLGPEGGCQMTEGGGRRREDGGQWAGFLDLGLKDLGLSPKATAHRKRLTADRLVTSGRREAGGFRKSVIGSQRTEGGVRRSVVRSR